MSYASVAELCDLYGYAAIAECLDDDDLAQRVDVALFRQAVQEQDTSSADQADQDAVARVIERATEALDSASRRMDQKISCRYDLPLSETVIEANDLSRHACQLARALLSKHHINEQVARLADESNAWLRDLAAGRAKLLGIELQSGTLGAAGEVLTEQGISRYDWEAHA